MNLAEQSIISYLKKHLSKEKYHHVLGMTALAEKLAVKHHLNKDRVRIAGLLHDLARAWSEKRIVQYVHTHSLKIPNKKFILKYKPSLLHGAVSAHRCQKMFSIKDKEVLSAVSKHTLASIKMSSFDKLIYVADLAAPDRKYKWRKHLVQVAFENIDLAFEEALAIKMQYVLKTGGWMHPDSVRIWNHFVCKNSKV